MILAARETKQDVIKTTHNIRQTGQTLTHNGKMPPKNLKGQLKIIVIPGSWNR